MLFVLCERPFDEHYQQKPMSETPCDQSSKPSARAETKFYGATKKLTFHNFESGLRIRYHAHKRLKLF